MKRIRFTFSLALVAALGVGMPGTGMGTLGTARAEEPAFGRAGGTVGAARIADVVRSATIAGEPAQAGQVYGNAGSRVGAEAIEHVAHTARPSIADDTFAAGLGRAGGPAALSTERRSTKMVEAR